MVIESSGAIHQTSKPLNDMILFSDGCSIHQTTKLN